MNDMYDNIDRFVPLVDKIWGLYQFIGMDKDEFFNFVVNGVKGYSYDEEGEVSFYDFYYKTIIGITNQYIKDTFENKDYKILFNYIDTIWKDGGENKPISYKRAITGLKKIDSFMEGLDIELGADELTNIISTNQKLQIVMDVVTTKDKALIEAGNFSKYGKTSGSLIEAYCIENGINFQDDVEDNLDIVDDGSTPKLVDDDGLDTDASVVGVSDFSNMDFYYQLIREYPVLEPEEVRTLVLKMQDGSKEARDKLIYSNLRLVISIAKRFVGRGVPFDDLVQEGIIGLNTGIERYSLDKNTKLSTYSTWWIRQTIQRYIADHGRNIRVPVYIIERVNRLELAIKNLTVEYGREPRISEIAERMGLSEKQVTELYSYRTDTVSLNKRIDSDEETELGAFIASEGNLEEAYLSPTMEEIIEICKDAGVKDKELYILLSHLASDDKTTLEDLGQEYGITRERIRQIEEKALKKIARSRFADKLVVYSSNPDLILEAFKRYRVDKPTGSYKVVFSRIKDGIREEQKEKCLASLGSNDEKEVLPSDEANEKIEHPNEGEIKKTPSSTEKKDTGDVAPSKKHRRKRASTVTILSKEETQAILNRKNIQITVFEYLGISEEDYYKYIDSKLSAYDKSIIEKKFSKPVPGRRQLGEVQKFEFYHNILPKLERMAKEIKGESLPPTTKISQKGFDSQATGVLNTSSREKNTEQKKEGQNMSRRNLQTIFEYLGVSSEDYYKYIEPKLSGNDKALITARYGADLENPDLSITIDKQFSSSFYGGLVPRMRRIAAQAGLIEPVKRRSSKKEETKDAGSSSNNQNPNLGGDDLPLPNENPDLKEENVQQNDGKLDEVSVISSMDDKSLDDYISTLTLECQEIENRILEKRSKLDEAVSLYEKRERLLARERELDLEIASKLNSGSKGQVKEKLYD